MAQVVKFPYEVYLFHRKDSKNYAVIFGACSMQLQKACDSSRLAGDTVIRVSGHRTLEAAKKKACEIRQDVLFSSAGIDYNKWVDDKIVSSRKCSVIEIVYN